MRSTMTLRILTATQFMVCPAVPNFPALDTPRSKGRKREGMATKLCLLLAVVSNAAWAANTLVMNANVITVDKNHPSAQAFAFDNGRFTAVGTNKQILKLRTPSTIVIDLKGMTV